MKFFITTLTLLATLTSFAQTRQYRGSEGGGGGISLCQYHGRSAEVEANCANESSRKIYEALDVKEQNVLFEELPEYVESVKKVGRLICKKSIKSSFNPEDKILYVCVLKEDG